MTLAQRVRQEGLEEGLREAALRHLFVLLEERFGLVPEGLREEVVRVDDISRLETLYRQAIHCASLEAFAALL